MKTKANAILTTIAAALLVLAVYAWPAGGQSPRGGGYVPATLQSPALTGTPTAPTAAPATANTQIATTAFVRSATMTAGQAFTALSIQSAAAARGPHAIAFADPLFNSTRDPVMGVGYNLNPSGVALLAGEPGFNWNVEGNYNDGSGANKIESYWQYVSSDGATITRPLFVAMNRSTNKVSNLVLKADTIKLLWEDGSANEAGGNLVTFSKDSTNFYSATAANNNLSINAPASFTGVLNQGYNANNTYFQQYVYGNDSFNFILNGQVPLRLYSKPQGGVGAAITVGSDENGAAGTFVETMNNMKALVARRKSGNNLDVFQVQESDGTTVFLGVSSTGNTTAGGSVKSTSATGGIGYGTGAGGTVTQGTDRTTGVTLNTVAGAITLISAAGSATYQSFTVTDSAVGANDTVRVCQKSGTDLYEIHVTAVAAGSFRITYRTTGGTTTEQPIFNFSVIKGVTSDASDAFRSVGDDVAGRIGFLPEVRLAA